VGRAGRRLILRSEQGLNLIVCLVDGAGPPRLFFALATQLERGFRKRLLTIIGGFAVRACGARRLD
jgi:hypothetical protein